MQKLDLSIHPYQLVAMFTVASPVASASGTIIVSYTDDKICITEISLHTPTVHTGDISVDFTGLGIFDLLAEGVVDVIVAGFKPQLLSLLSSKLTPLLNNEINSQLPYPK